MDVTAMGKQGLTGWRGKVGSKVAEPVAARTSLSQEQVEALIGGVFLLLSLWQFIKLFRRVFQAGMSGEVQE